MWLRLTDVAEPNHEAKAEYSITIEVKGDEDSDMKATLAVTITVNDEAEAWDGNAVGTAAAYWECGDSRA